MQRLLLAVVLAVTSTATAAPLRSVAMTHGRDLCAVDARGAIACTNAHDAPTVELPPARDIALSYVLAFVDDKGKLAVWNKHQEKVEDLALPFAVRRIGFVGEKLCAFGAKGELACGAPEKGGLKVLSATPKTRFVSVVFGLEALWLLDEGGGLWCEGGGGCARLHAAAKNVPVSTPFPGPAWNDAFPKFLDKTAPVSRWRVTGNVTRIHAGGGTCIERPKLPVACWSWDSAPSNEVDPRAAEMVTLGNNLCWRTGDAITCRFIEGPPSPYDASPRSPMVQTQTVKGATRLHAHHDKLCVETASASLVCTKIAGRTKIAPFAPVVWAKN